MTSVFCALLAFGLLGSYVSEDSKRASAQRESHSTVLALAVHKATFAVIACEFVFGLLLLIFPQRMFGPGGLLPLFRRTTNQSGSSEFDPVMLYAARMKGTTFMPLLVAIVYRTSLPWLSYRFMMTSLLLTLSLDVVGVLDDTTIEDDPDHPVFYNLMFLISILIRTTFLIIVHLASFQLSLCTETDDKKRQ